MTAPRRERNALERTPFFGREREQRLLATEFERHSRLLTITGPSGMGKTRLALRVIADEPAAIFCPIGARASRSRLESVVGEAIGASQQSGLPLARALAAMGPLLLVLDEVQALAPDALAILELWLEHAPELRLLVTSIVPLGIDGEVRFELGPLDTADAVQLYLAAARLAWADRLFAPEERAAVEELVERLDHMPLAVELAAARVRILPPRALLPRLDDRFELLQATGPLPSLAEAVEASWQLLGPAEALALARLSVFAGPFSLEAAEAVLADDGAHPFDLLDALRSKTLLRLLEAEDAPRFILSQSGRLYAAARLREAGRVEETQQRQAAFFLHLAEQEASRAEGPEAPVALRWLVAERENLAAVHGWLRTRDSTGAARVGLALAVALSADGSPAAEASTLDDVVACAREGGDAGLLARALRMRSRACRRFGRLYEARMDLDEALQRVREVGDEVQEGFVLAESGSLRTHCGKLALAREELDLALRIAERIGDPLVEGCARSARGAVEESSGDLEAGAMQLDRALAIFRRSGNPRLLGATLLGLGVVRSGQGRFREARLALEEACGLFRRLGIRVLEADAQSRLGSAFLIAGLLDEAESWSRQALARERAMGNRRTEATALGNLGCVALERGDAAQGEQHLNDALAILDELGERRLYGLFLCFAAAAEARNGRLREARSSLADARSCLREVGDAAGLAASEVLEGLIELEEATLSRSEADAAALEGRARARLQAAPSPSEGVLFGLRLLQQALDRRGAPTDEPRVVAAGAGLVIGPEAGWFQFAGGERVDLRRRGAVRLMLLRLVEQRLSNPGTGIGQQALSEIGWPGERILPEAAATRVYSGIRTLRSLGLGHALRRHADGYLLDPAVPVSRAG